MEVACGASMLLRGFGLGARPSREFAPAGDLLSGPPESRQRAAPAKPPLRCASGCPAMLEARGRAQLASFAALTTLRQRGAKSEVDARCARALGCCASRRFRRGDPKQPNSQNSQQPNATSLRSRLFSLSPLEPAEQRKALRARAQHASTTDSAQLFERSVAKRVLRGPSRPEQRREARRAGRVGGRLFAYFLVAQKVGRPPGRTPGMGLARKPSSTPSA